MQIYVIKFCRINSMPYFYGIITTNENRINYKIRRTAYERSR